MVIPSSFPLSNENLDIHIDLSEQNLIAGLRSRDEKAISTLYDRYSAALFGIISRIIKFDEIAEDVLQETFVKIWKSIDQYNESRGKLFTWTARLAKNTATDHLRGRAYLNSSKNADINDVSAEVDRKNQMLYNPETIGIQKLTTNLSAPQKAILDLVYFQGYSHSEVAEALDIPPGTVKTRLRTAISTLRKYFD